VQYVFHGLTENTITHHVRRQLQDRITSATPDQKDLYFLTALLDRNTLDADVQEFRQNHPHFKEELIQCWNEDVNLLTKITQNVASTVETFKKSSQLEFTPTIKKVYSDAPGPYKLNQILVCLKIVKDIYNLNKNLNISQIIVDSSKERLLRDYLLKLYGVGPKLANWSMTNVTGHWFVIDRHIEKEIGNNLKYTISNMEICGENADKIFAGWFGILNENQHQYGRLSQKQFIRIFPDFLPSECEYLPFIMTQYLWFHGKFG
jgi:hypothetical protein